MGNKAYVEAQDCRKCPKRDEHGDCTGPGLCIYQNIFADGEAKLRETPHDPLVMAKMGERGYLSLIEKMDIVRRKEIFKKNPTMSKIITMLVAGATYTDIEKALHVHRRTISKAKKLWLEMKDDKEKAPIAGA